MLTQIQLAWCGGFMSADGCFTWTGGTKDGKGGTPCISVTQVSRDTVAKLADMFGVDVYEYSHSSSSTGTIFRVQIYGPSAIKAMKDMYEYLSPIKQKNVDSVLDRWNKKPKRGAYNAAKTHCKHGHEYTEENTYHKKSGGRDCKTCIREYGRRYAERKKLTN